MYIYYIIKKKDDMNTEEILKSYIKQLLKLGFKNYELGIEKGYGVYFITLPHTAYSFKKLLEISKIFNNRSFIGNYPAISKEALSINTNISL